MSRTVLSTSQYTHTATMTIGHFGSADTVNYSSKSQGPLANSVTYGDNLPNWRQLVASGLNATTSLSGLHYVYQHKPGYWALYTYYNPGVVPGLNQPPPGESARCDGLYSPSIGWTFTDPGTYSETAALNLAKIRFSQKVTEVNTRFQGGVFLGELAETLHMIRKPAHALRKSVNTYFATLKKRERGLRRVLGRRPLKASKRKLLAETWLEWAYGWRPLLSDARQAAEALASLNDSRAPHKRVTARYEQLSAPEVGTLLESIGSAIWKQSYHREERVLVIIRGSVRVEPSSRQLFSSTLWGFDPVQWVPTAWELIPYSFLVDYFTNVGDVLACWAASRSAIEWTNYTTVKENKYVLDGGQFVQPTPNAGTNQFVQGRVPGGFYLRRKVDRYTTLGSLIPSFSFEIPGLGTKWINLAALLGTRRKTPFY